MMVIRVGTGDNHPFGAFPVAAGLRPQRHRVVLHIPVHSRPAATGHRHILTIARLVICVDISMLPVAGLAVNA